MRFTPTVDGREVRIDAPLPDTSRGRDTATMIRNGTMTGLSIEFRATDEGMAGGDARGPRCNTDGRGRG